MKLFALPLALLVVTVAAPSAGAATDGGFCSVARGVGRDLASVTSLGRRPNVKASYLRIATAEPALNASAPRSLKPHLRPIFSFVNLLIADFDKVGWQPAGMAQYFPKLLPRAEAVTPHLHVVDAYLKGTCKLGT